MRTIGDTSTRRSRSRAAAVVSLVLHVALGIVVSVLLLMETDVYQILDSMDIVWMDELSEPQQVKRRLKVKLEQRLNDPDKPIALKDPDKLMKEARNQLTEVAELSERIVVQDVQKNDMQRIDQLEEMMTAADLQTDVTSLTRLRSMPGRTDGQGEVTGRTRTQGSGLGSMLFGNDGKGGLLGGGGNSGDGDPLGIIDFLRNRGDGGRIVYVLDVSASMGAAGLHKLGLAKESLIDHMYLLSEQDEFSIVTFASSISRMGTSAVPATAENLGKAEGYLGRFTQESITGNLGTNTLGAIQTAFDMGPDVVVLLTDGVPTSAGGQVVETDPDKIIRAAHASNRTEAALFIVGLEIDNLGGPGELLLKQLAENTGGKVKFVGRSDLLLYKDKLAAARPEPTQPN
ncbi:VWA domain-containing protein [Candidatus Poribacteria bacterium]|jgi:hypothetical protein|nr:VWA domain-containing protein [Candidatus Poribacteria bacterium]MBT5711738.1 VWA domain-containing protein [Candidatus Poribacteria bacterium]MBT7101511.1 VWA domain-containing protein [Candidatus Poribacteria bacterium]MBT7809330.1 VWA domain-containing protein [Candidatus Poribacteria bacterium]